MSVLLAFCLISVVVCSLGAKTKNALYGFDVQMHSDPKAPRILLVNEQGDVVVDELATQEFTWCLYTYLEEKKDKTWYTLWGYGSKEHEQANEMLIEFNFDDDYTLVTVRKSEVRINGHPPVNQWSLFCVSWSGITGKTAYSLDGKVMGSAADFMINETIGKEGIISVGQDQDGWDSGYAPEDGVYGKVTQFNAWDRVLNDKELQLVVDGKLYGNKVDWRTSSWALAGNAVLLPTDAPNAALQKATCKGDEEPIATDLSICLRLNGDSVAHETFTLFYYMNSYGTKELALVINATRATSGIIGIEERQLPHLTVCPGWQHWCFVWSNNMLSVYMNGGYYDTLEDFSEGTQMSTNGDLYIQEENSRKRVKAQTSDVNVWERALSRADVDNEYRKVEENYGVKTYLVASPISVADSTPYVRRYWQPRQVMTYTR